MLLLFAKAVFQAIWLQVSFKLENEKQAVPASYIGTPGEVQKAPKTNSFFNMAAFFNINIFAKIKPLHFLLEEIIGTSNNPFEINITEPFFKLHMLCWTF